jgi:hypothetical protein
MKKTRGQKSRATVPLSENNKKEAKLQRKKDKVKFWDNLLRNEEKY